MGFGIRSHRPVAVSLWLAILGLVVSCGGPAVAAAGGAPRSGEEVYNTACMACHSTGAAGAPKVGDAAAWADRIAKGMDALHASGVNGVAGTGMIAKGGCVACSDEEVYAAVDFMVAGSK